MNQTRYIYYKEPLSQKDRKAYVKRVRADLKEEIAYRKRQIQALKLDLKNLKAPTHITLQKELNPGDPGDEEAPVRFIPTKLSGRHNMDEQALTIDKIEQHLVCRCGAEADIFAYDVHVDRLVEELDVAAAEEAGWHNIEQCQRCYEADQRAIRDDYLYDEWKERQLLGD